MRMIRHKFWKDKTIPVKGDKFFTGFENEYHPKKAHLGIYKNGLRILKIMEVEGVIIDDKLNAEGRSITASDGVGYDCFWSKRHGIFVYALERKPIIVWDVEEDR